MGIYVFYLVMILVGWLLLGSITNALMYRIDRETLKGFIWGEFPWDNFMGLVFAPVVLLFIIFWVIPSRLIRKEKIFYR